MTKHTLNYGDGNDTVAIGSSNWDDGDDYTIRTYGGNDDITLYVDGTSWVDMGSGDDKIYINGSGTATVYGGSGDDDFDHGTNQFDDGVAIMHGGDGNDYFGGLGGAYDVMYGDSGNDFFSMELHNKAYGGTGDDAYWTFENDQANVTIIEYADQGYDVVHGRFTKYVFGANIEEYHGEYGGNFTCIGNDQANTVDSWGENDYFDMRGGDDRVSAGEGNDTIWGGDGNDGINGGDGQDIIYGGLGNDNLSGGSIWDSTGSSQDDYIYGGDGDDSIDGGPGSDRLHGDAGNDTIMSKWGTATMFGGTGNDTYVVEGMGTTIVENANEGVDTIQFYGPWFVMSANVENLTHVNDPRGTSVGYHGATEITGNALANTITGNDDVNTMEGMAGADSLYGKGGNDVLRGGDNDDRVWGETGNDLLYGDAGNDTMAGGTGADYAYGGEGNDVIAGNDGNDYVIGENGNDTVWGGNGGDLVNGGGGYDQLHGEDGDDLIRAGADNDYVYGEGGNDRIYGEGGSDYLYGGVGNDVFFFSALTDSNIGTGIDRIQDFAAGQDRIDLSIMDANILLSGNQAFSWGGAAAPGAGHAGTAWTQYFGASAYSSQFVRVYGDVNGDGTADFSIDVMNVTSMASTDFLF